MTGVRITIGDLSFHLVPRHWRDSHRERTKATRIYVSDSLIRDDAAYAELVAAEEQLGELRNATRGEHPDVDKLYDRLNRRHGRAKREVAQRAIIALFDQRVTLKLTAAWDAKLVFSRRAGCTCTCSPGCIIATRLRVEGIGTVDVYVEPAKQD